MKLNKALLLLSLTLMPLTALADMTDTQIIQYVSEQSAKGTSQAEMVQYLLNQGVSPQRLQQLKAKLSKKGTSSNNGKVSTGDRTRTANTDRNSSGRIVGNASKNGKFEEQSEDYLSMESALTDLSSQMSPEMEEQGSKYEKKIFGHEMFKNEDIKFEPNMNIATPSTYVLGAGDLVFIDIYGASQVSIEGTISPDGEIIVKGYGPLHLGGLSVEQANQRVRTKLSSYFADSKIKLTVGQTRTIQVNVMGEVKTPGTYTLSAFASAFHALYSAGGVSEVGSLRSIKLYRENKLISIIDLYDYILNGQLSGDIRLQDNDVLIVAPYEALVNISGKAKRPMYYEMKTSETIGKALEYAGGFAGDAYTKSMRLVRMGGDRMQVFNIDESNLGSFLVADGDSVYIDSVMVRYDNMIDLQGAVFRPGMYQLGDRTSSIKSLLEYAGGVTEYAFTSHAVLRRKRADRSLEIIPIDLEHILNGTASDVVLKNEDVLFIPDRQNAQESQTLTIRGEVYEPGIYEFAHNTSVEDLVLLAGGLKESASTEKVSIARRQENGQIKNFTVNLSKDLSCDTKNAFILKPFDVVMIKRIEGYCEPQTVHIEGEVNFQGDYSITNEKSRISDVISMAGGLTNHAAQNGVYVLRKLSEEEKRMRQKRLDTDRFNYTYRAIQRSSQMQGVTSLPISDSLMIVKDTREDIYKVAVNIQKAIKKPGCKEDLILQDGDYIIVEGQTNTVRLSGSVAYQGAVPYVSGKTLKYYLRQGGIRPTRQNCKLAYVISPNGQANSYRKFKKIEPGSEIFLRESRTEMTTDQRVNMWIAVTSAFATAAAVVISVIK
ncbi:MAG: SLBB domain-containing protein [Bacteroidales bacterium]|nr:SLBB domain-containing protein [Bacteroidales bacterium]